MEHCRKADGVHRVLASLLVGDAVALEARSRSDSSVQGLVRARWRMRGQQQAADSLVRSHTAGVALS